MSVLGKQGWSPSYKLLTETTYRSEAGQSSLPRYIIMIWIIGTLVLLPLYFIKLPSNMNPVDIWVIGALPVFWLFFILWRQTINTSYMLAFGLILVGSLASIYAAPEPLKGLVVTFKGIYLFIWFLTLAALFSGLNDKDLRRILIVWSGVAILHGGLIGAQFLSPDIWQISSSIAGHPAEYDVYRPSGLFICEDAGCANKAAFFQLLGFVPLLLAGFSKRVTVILGIFLLSSMLATGSMGATIAFTAGLIIAIIAVSVLGKISAQILKKFVMLLIAISLFGGLFFYITSQNQVFQEHIERILLGRAERSSGGRFDLWQDGIDHLLERNIPLWGVGPENFREFGAKGKQLHNDMLAFVVERGLIGMLGLVLLGVIAVGRAFYLLLIHSKSPERSRLVVAIFLAAMVAILVESLTHQIFHARQVWLVLALQEAMLYKAMNSKSGLKPSSLPLNGLSRNDHRFVVSRDVPGG